MTKKTPLWLFTILFLAAMFLPRLVQQGMFGDGLLYASLARNLAEGKGTMWAPFFSSGYWIDFASGNPYFENPPLMIWLQAGFFSFFGDHWWVEKLYALLLFILNSWLIVRVWETPLRGSVFQGKYGWLPLFFWYFMPTVIWGNPNNLMDNNLLTFCLLALLFAFDGLFSGKRIWLKMTLAGICVFLGIMTKGPVALYPAVAPFLFAVALIRPTTLSRRTNITQGIFQSAWIGFLAIGLFFLMLALIPESRTYFENYWEKRLGVVISGARQDAELSGWARLSIFEILAKELAGMAGAFFFLFFIFQKKYYPACHSERSEESAQANDDNTHIAPGQMPPNVGMTNLKVKKISLLFLLLGFAATLPLMLSARQSGMYIIPGLPMFALAAGYFLLPSLHGWLGGPSEKMSRFLKKLKAWSVAGSFILLAYVLFLFGKPGREKALLNDLPYLQQVIPQGEKVAVCERLMSDLHAHAYLQRFHHLELARDFLSCQYALTDRRCDISMNSILERDGFEKVGGGGAFFIYRKK
jgi:4-amino-4-deoxy-L-arabinose transferase-like glycosyltransferase